MSLVPLEDFVPRDDFDLNDPANVGRPKFWRLDNHIAAVEQLIRADELQMALELLDKVPGWWRDNYPEALREIKRTLYRQTYDQIEYATDDDEAEMERATGEAQWMSEYCYPRAEILNQIVRASNDACDIPPWILDLGCSHGNAPLGMLKAGLAFTYRGAGMNKRIVEKLRGWIGERVWQDKPLDKQPTILYCTEVIEHCMNPLDIVHSAYKVGVDFDTIVLSVPMYCLGFGLADWQTRRLGHVRNWTPSELADFANKHWPGYAWELYKSSSMVLVGRKNV